MMNPAPSTKPNRQVAPQTYWLEEERRGCSRDCYLPVPQDPCCPSPRQCAGGYFPASSAQPSKALGWNSVRCEWTGACPVTSSRAGASAFLTLMPEWGAQRGPGRPRVKGQGLQVSGSRKDSPDRVTTSLHPPAHGNGLGFYEREE